MFAKKKNIKSIKKKKEETEEEKKNVKIGQQKKRKAGVKRKERDNRISLWN